MTVRDLAATGEALHRELGREYYLTGAGHKQEAAFQAIYERYAELTGDEALEAARETGPLPVLEWLVDLRLGRALAPLEERQLAWERQAAVSLDGDRVAWLEVPILLQNTPERERRIALDQARARLAAAELVPLRRDRFERERALMANLGWADYVHGVAELSGIDLDGLGAQCESLLEQTADLYADALGRLVRRRIGVPRSALLRADVSWAFRADGYDAAFPPDRLMPTAVEQMRAMGLDAAQGGRVRFDTEDRPGKQPRAFCVPVDVPREVYLVLRPHGGHADYRTFWHELGHAMHYAAVDPGRPFHERWLGDNSVTEGFAMLWDALTMTPAWLERYSAVPASAMGDLRFELAIHELYMLRRYAAKLRYELALHRGDYGAMGPTYAELLTDATGFRYEEVDALVDVDPGFYAARYLRAWQLSSQVAETFRDRFDIDWFRNPRAGALVHHLMSRGQADPAHRLAEDATGRPLTFAPVVARLEAPLS